MRRAATIAVLLVALAGGCGGAGDGPDAPTVVEGTIVSLEHDAGTIRSFTVRGADRETHELFPADEVAYGLVLNHPRQNRAVGAPVRSYVESLDGRLVAPTLQHF